jgi:hypothetical protein
MSRQEEIFWRRLSGRLTHAGYECELLPFPGDQLRDYIVALLRTKVQLTGHDREMIARAINLYWRSDPKHDRLIARCKQAKMIDMQILEERAWQRANDAIVMTKAQARQNLRGRHNSGEALYKWLRRNRRRPGL